MAFTLGFHIVLASLGVAFPAIMLIANYRGLRHDDADALLLARRWSKVVAVTFAVGAVTGTVLSFELARRNRAEASVNSAMASDVLLEGRPDRRSSGAASQPTTATVQDKSYTPLFASAVRVRQGRGR